MLEFLTKPSAPRGEVHSSIRGRFRTTTEGRFRFWTIMPHFYLIPHNGPVRQMLEAMVWHPFRPAHVHLMVSCLAYEKLVMHVFEEDDPYLDSDAVFGVKARSSRISGFSRRASRRMASRWRGCLTPLMSRGADAAGSSCS
ncbi:MAG: hypothetical protein E7K72_26130, partial [Roseomonas mucosa]|nr:hypothetical protein [Roseomonas mucosa]